MARGEKNEQSSFPLFVCSLSYIKCIQNFGAIVFYSIETDTCSRKNQYMKQTLSLFIVSLAFCTSYCSPKGIEHSQMVEQLRSRPFRKPPCDSLQLLLAQ